MSNPFTKFFTIPNFNESNFVVENGLAHNEAKKLGFEEVRSGGFVIYRRSNELGGFDYLPFVERWWPGSMPDVDPEKDRWLAGYETGVVMLIAGEVHNRQWVRISADGEVSKHPPE